MPGKLAGIAALGIMAKDQCLAGIDFLDIQKHPVPQLKSTRNKNKTCSFILGKTSSDQAYTRIIVDQLAQYFEHPGWEFTLNIETNGTAFQKKVWRKLETINYDQRRTYGELAKNLSTSPRAIGGACRSNPVPVVVPCHRVVSANGPGGFCGTSDVNSFALKIKNWLLEHEKSDGVRK